MKTRRSTVATAAVLTTVALAVTGCGGSSSSATSGGTSPAARSGVDPTQLNAIRQCLKAAGLSRSISDGAPSGMPSNLPSGMPSNLPSGMPSNLPSGMPSNLPSGAPTDLPSNFSGGPGGQFDNPEVQAALKACGIELPTPQGG